MAKANFFPPIPIEQEVHLELSFKEAVVLRAMLGYTSPRSFENKATDYPQAISYIEGGTDGPLYTMFHALDSLLGVHTK